MPYAPTPKSKDVTLVDVLCCPIANAVDIVAAAATGAVCVAGFVVVGGAVCCSVACYHIDKALAKAKDGEHYQQYHYGEWDD